MDQTLDPTKTKEIVLNLALMGFVGPSLAINNRCNLRCSHCYILQGDNFINNFSKNQFDQERTIQIVRDFKGTIPFISIAAMEPFLTSDSRQTCIKVGKEVNNWRLNGLETQFGIISNLIEAPKMSDEEVEYLNKFSRYVAFSLEHGNPSLNDAIRGRGAFDKTIKGAKYLIERGFNPRRMIIEGTIHPHLDIGEQVRSLLYLGGELNIGKVSVNPYIPPVEKLNIDEQKRYYSNVHEIIIRTLREEGSKVSPIEFTLYSTYETPVAAKMLLDRLVGRNREKFPDLKVNTFDASYYANIPGLGNIDGIASVALWPMEELIAPRIVAARNNRRINLKENVDYDSGTEITYCFGFQKDTPPAGYWIPGLFQELNRKFMDRQYLTDLIGRLSIPDEAEVITIDPSILRTRGKYVEDITETLLRRSMQKIHKIRKDYLKVT